MSFAFVLFLTMVAVVIALASFAVVIVKTNLSVSRGFKINSRHINRSHNTDYKIGDVDATLVNCEI